MTKAIVARQARQARKATKAILVASNVVNTSFSSMGIFKNLGVGAHTISFWHRQVAATQCIRNSGGFVTTVTVEELEVKP